MAACCTLQNYWTYTLLPEKRFYDALRLHNGTVVHHSVVPFNRSLWVCIPLVALA